MYNTIKYQSCFIILVLLWYIVTQKNTTPPPHTHTHTHAYILHVNNLLLFFKDINLKLQQALFLILYQPNIQITSLRHQTLAVSNLLIRRYRPFACLFFHSNHRLECFSNCVVTDSKNERKTVAGDYGHVNWFVRSHTLSGLS